MTVWLLLILFLLFSDEVGCAAAIVVLFLLGVIHR